VARLHHVILPSSDHMHAAEFLATIFGVEPSPANERYPYSPSLKLDGIRIMFSEAVQVPQHLAFHVTPAELDGILGRIQEHGLAYGDDAGQPDNSKVRTDDRGYGYRAIWIVSPDKTLLEFFSFDVLPEGYSSPAVMPAAMTTQ
jgi:hypothetical protein